MARIRRSIAALLTAIAIGGTGAVEAGAAHADPPLAAWTLVGYNIGTVGDHDFCHGAFNVNMSATRGRPGTVHLTLSSFGFTGQGPGWGRNPVCRTLVIFTHTSAAALYHETYIPVAFGPAPGQRVERDIFTGSGVVMVSIGTYAINTPVRVPQAYASNYYVAVP